VMKEKLGYEGLSADAIIRYDPVIFESSLMGGLFNAESAYEDISIFVEKYL